MSDAPVPYTPTAEQIQPDEAQTNAELVATLLKISRTTYEDGKGALRSVHAKSHGVLRGKVTVLPGLPPTLAQGLFAAARSFDAAIRFSTTPGDPLPDSVSTPRGMAIKLFDVPGVRLPGSEDATTQDFVLVTGKAFNAPDTKHFLKNLELLAGTTDKGEGLKVALSAVLRGAESALEAVGGESATVKSLGGYPAIHILGESFFSQVPIRYGDYIAKIGVVPIARDLTDLTNKPVDLSAGHDALRDLVRAHFATKGGLWDIRVQLCTDLKDMPVENATVAWDEEKSPYIAVARLEVPAQDSWSGPSQEKIDKAMAFSPWHGIAAHQPLGSIMRARRQAYPASAQFRLEKNGCPFAEPRGL
jgi:hypothetical protein